MELISQLKQLGYTEYEAKAYIALVQNNNVTAYQVSKDSKVPRARVYDTLNQLVEKGLVMKEETPDQTTYSAIPISIFIQKTEQQWQSNFTSITDQLKVLEQKKKEEENQILIIRDKETILSFCTAMLKRAKEKVLISMWDDVYNILREDLEEIGKKVPIHGITINVDNPIATVDQHRTTNYIKAQTTAHWFIIAVDGNEMIYGPSPFRKDLAFFTDDAFHINFLEDYIWHDVLVNRLVKRSDDNLNDWITKERSSFFLENKNNH